MRIEDRVSLIRDVQKGFVPVEELAEFVEAFEGYYSTDRGVSARAVGGALQLTDIDLAGEGVSISIPMKTGHSPYAVEGLIYTFILVAPHGTFQLAIDSTPEYRFLTTSHTRGPDGHRVSLYSPEKYCTLKLSGPPDGRALLALFSLYDEFEAMLRTKR